MVLLLEAAMDLGSTKLKALWKVMLPSIKGGIIAGIILVLIPALGSYAIPELVGGKDGAMLGREIKKPVLFFCDNYCTPSFKI